MKKKVTGKIKKLLSIVLAILIVLTSMPFDNIAVKAEETEACDHTYEVVEIVDATCTEEGYKVEHCTKCFSSKEETVNFDEYPTIENERDESEKYPYNMDKTYKFTSPYENTIAITFTFDERTQFETGFDFAYIHDGDGNLVYDSGEYTDPCDRKKEAHAYTGTSLANRTFTVDTDSFDVRVTSDGSGSYYGFRISEIKVTVATGYKRTKILKLDHDFSNGQCTVCKSFEKPVQVTEDNYESLGLGSDFVGYYAISNATDLAWVAEETEKNGESIDCVLTKDIDYTNYSTDDYLLGSTNYSYKGTFDGQFHKITVNIDSNYNAALFQKVGGKTTIKNLYVDGNIKTAGKYASGIVSLSDNASNVVIENCVSSVNIVSDLNGDGTHGGILGVSQGTSTAINNCAFVGSINDTSETNQSNTTSCAGIIGWAGGDNNNVLNCYVSADFGTSTEGCAVIGRNNPAVTNCFYVNDYGTVNSGATKITASQLESGELAYILNGSTNENPKWYQTLLIDSYPVPDSSHGVINYVAADEEKGTAAYYTNSTNLDCTHENKTLIKQVDGDCNTKSYEIYLCDDCNAAFSVDGDIQHDYQYIYNNDGTHSQACSKCSKVKENSTENCTFGEWTKVDKDTHKRVCSVCNGKETEDHNYAFVEHVDGDCTHLDYDVYKCSTCEDQINKNEKYAHSFVRTKVVNPTCTKQGYTLYTCENCPETEKRDFVDATDHSYEVIDTVDATCTEKGYKKYKCSSCGKQKEEEEDALGHILSQEPIKVIEPTCTESGTKIFLCERCGEEIGKSKIDTSYFQSKHPYSNNLGQSSDEFAPSKYEEGISCWTYTGSEYVESIDITFSNQTYFESGCDWIKIYDKDYNIVFNGRTYSDGYLAGKTIHIEGNSFIIALNTDYSVTEWGFALDNITENYSSDYNDIFTIPALKHDFKDGVCTRCDALEHIAKVSYKDEEDKTVEEGFEEFYDAWQFAQGKTATITLYGNVDAEGTSLSATDPSSDITLDFSKYDIEASFELAKGKYTFNGTTGTISSNQQFAMINIEADLIINGGKYVGNNYISVLSAGNLTIKDGEFKGKIAGLGIANVSGITEKSKINIAGGKYYSGIYGSIVCDSSLLKGSDILAPGFVGYSMDEHGNKQDRILLDDNTKATSINGDVIVAAHEDHTYNKYGKCSVCGAYDDVVTEDTVAVVTIGDKYTAFNSIEEAFEAAKGQTANIALIKENTNINSDIVISNEDTNITIDSKEQYLLTNEDGGKIFVNSGTIKVNGSLAFDCFELNNGQSYADLCSKGYALYDKDYAEVEKPDTITASSDLYYINTHTNHSYGEDGMCTVCKDNLPIKVDVEDTESNTTTYYFSDFNQVKDLNVSSGANVNVTLLKDVVIHNRVLFDNSSPNYYIDFGKNTLQCDSFNVGNAKVTLDGTTGGILSTSNDPTLSVSGSGSLNIKGGNYDGMMGKCLYVTNPDSVKISGGKFYQSYNGNIIDVSGEKISSIIVPGYVLKDSSGNIIDTSVKTQISGNTFGDYVQVEKHTDHEFMLGYCTVCDLPSSEITEGTVAIVAIGDDTTFYNTVEEAFEAAKGKTATICLLKDVDLAENILIDNADSNIVFMGKATTLSGNNHTIKVASGNMYFEGQIAFDCIEFENGKKIPEVVKKPYCLYDEEGNAVTEDIVSAQGKYYYVDKCRKHNFVKGENHDVTCSLCGAVANLSLEVSGQPLHYVETFMEAIDIVRSCGQPVTVSLLNDVVEEQALDLNIMNTMNLNLDEYTLTCKELLLIEGNYIINATTGGINTTNGSIYVDYSYVEINGGVYTSNGRATIEGNFDCLRILSGKFYNLAGKTIFADEYDQMVGNALKTGYVIVDNMGEVFDSSQSTISINDSEGYLVVEKHKNHSFEEGVCPVCGAVDESIAYASVTIDDEVEYFDSFVKAINYADGNIATVKLLRDSTESEGTTGYAEISSGDITIDLNEHTFTYDSAIYVKGGDITFTGNGTIDSSGDYAVNVYPNMSTNITFENGTYICNEDTVEWDNDSGYDSSLIFNNATIEGESDAVLVRDAYNMNITVNGGTFNGIENQAFDIDNNSSTDKTSIVINGGTFNSQNSDAIDLRYEGIEAIINDCIVDSYNDALYISDISKLTINGGTFTSESADALDYSCDFEEGQLNITGGTFIADDCGLEYTSSNKANITGGTFSSVECYDSDVYISDLLPTGYVFQNKDGQVFGATCSDSELDEQVTAIKHLGHNFVDGACIDCGVEGNYKVKVLANGEYSFYNTIEEAIEVVNSIESLESATISLMGDYTAEEILIDSTVDITLDFEGKTLNANQGITVQSGKVTFVGGNIVTQNDAYAVSAIGDAQVMLKSGTYDGISISEGIIGNVLYEGYVLFDGEDNVLFDHKSTDKATLETITVKKHNAHNFVDGICDECELEYVASVAETVDGETVTTVYGSFAEAWNYAQGKTATITLSKNDTIETSLESDNNDTDITVELGENVLSLGENRFELYQGKFVFNATTGGINSKYAIFDQNDTANLEINGGNYKSKDDMICVGVSDDSALKISNANLISTKGYVVCSHGGNIEIENSEIDTDSSIYFYNSKVDITDTEIIGGLHVSDYSILTLNNVDITAANDNTVRIDGGGKVTINGGTHSVVKDSYSALCIDSSDSELNITDGEFSSTDYCTMAVYAGKVHLTGGTFQSLNENEAIIIDNSDTYLSDLLGEYCYFETEDGAMVQNADTIYQYSDTVKAVKCQHEDTYVVAGDDVHHYVCEKCGFESEDEACEYEKYGKIYPCETEGADVYKCKVCSNSYKTDFTPQIGHSFTDYVSDNNATCTHDGTKTATCDNGCGKTDTITDEGTALGHEYEEEWYSNDNGTHSKDCIRDDDTITEDCEYTSTEDVAPTCTEKGYTLHTCKDCGYSYKDAYVDELGHSEGKPVTTKATPSKDGAIVTSCTTCNEQLTEVVIPQIKTVTLAQTSFEYDGNAKTPSVTVKDRTGSIIAASNYTVEYKNNIQVGMATVTVTFNSDKYEGTVSKSFEIKDITIVDNHYINVNAKVKTLNKKIKVSWGKVPGADGYDIYVTSGTKKAKFAKKPTISVKGNKLKSKTIKKVNGKKLSNSKNYKLNIKAYKLIDGKKVYICTSYTLYSVGTKNKSYTNAKKIKVKNSKINLKVNKSKKIVASIVKQNKKKKILSKSITANYRYWSSNKAVATVNKKGKVTGKNKGTCKVYVMAPNGVKKAVKVTVK